MDNMMRKVFGRRERARRERAEQEQKGLELGNEISTEKAREVPALKDKADQAIKDPLTGLLNRRGFIPYVEDAIARLGRQERNRTVSIIFIDIDDFKIINDTKGHEAGDRVLVEIAKLLKEHVRGTDKISRHGGEEFCVLFEDAGVENALKRAEKFLEMIRSLKIETENGPLSVTASIGVALRSRNDDFGVDKLIDRADNAMYRAKREGKNRVVLWTEPPDESQPGYQHELNLEG